MKVKVDYDTDCDFLLQEAVNSFGKFCSWHRRRNLGTLNRDEAIDYIDDAPEDSLKIPIFIYEHGGCILSTSPFSCPWDSGQVGLWIITSDEIIEMYGEDNESARKKAFESISNTVQYMSDIISGNVWYYEIEGSDGDVEDSCGGFVGDESLHDMKSHVQKQLHPELERAWEERFS